MEKFVKKINFKRYSVLAAFLTVNAVVLFAQTGGTGIQNAATEIKSYVGVLTTLAYAIGAIVGIIGGIRIYIKWSNGEEVNKDLLGWGGAFIFLMVLPTIVNAFFA